MKMNAKLLLAGISLVFATQIGISQTPNYRIYPSNVSQTEVLVTVHPSDPNILFATANTIRTQPSLFLSEGIYATTNGGSSWYGSDTCTGSPIGFHGGEPSIAIDRLGRFILTRLGISPFPGLFSHFSTDNGQTWSGQRSITADDLERAVIATDAFPSSPYYGNTYAAWIRFAPPYPLVFARTTDGAATWSSPAVVNNPTQRGVGGDLAVGPGGTIHACWAVVIASSPYTEIFTGYASSTNGGASWVVRENAFATNGIKGMLPQKQNIRVDGVPRIDLDRSGGPRNGWIYIVSAQKNLVPAGSDPDIILRRSTDGGASWSAGIRVNRDAINNGKIQYFPAIHVDAAGGVNIIYYDDRNTTSDSSGVYLSRSLDGGTSWADYPISDHNFRPAPVSGGAQGYQGDNIGLTSANNTLWPVWMDNSTGLYQIWTAPVSLSSVGVKEKIELSAPYEFMLEQNYPNPFNPVTVIRYQLPVASFVSLKVFDLLGREVAILQMNQVEEPGSHSVTWDASVFPSGVYVMRLIVGPQSHSRKVVLLK